MTGPGILFGLGTLIFALSVLTAALARIEQRASRAPGMHYSAARRARGAHVMWRLASRLSALGGALMLVAALWQRIGGAS